MKWKVPKEEKLISFLQGELVGYSGKFLRKVLDANCCRINGQIERFGSRRILRGDYVELSANWKSISTPKWTFDTLYEDPFLKIINKPSGWVSDPKNVEKGFYLVHRLDKETTGALILAKDETTRDALFELFEKREVTKTYIAIVDGIINKDRGRIESFFVKKRSYQGQTIWGSDSFKGLTAITNWEKLKEGDRATLVSLKPETGRTHQLRVHMAEMGHPIIIDRQYAKNFRCSHFSPRIMLHAERLQFTFQNNLIDVTAPKFPDMIDLLRNLGI